MLVVVRMEQDDKTGRYSTLRELEQLTKTLFGPNVLEDFQASAWPGTELIKHPANVYVVRFDESIAELILSTEPDLMKWLHVKTPPLPEDICLFNSSADSPTLVSVTHEKLFWIIAEQKPKLAGVRETNLPAEKLFWQGKYFCRPWAPTNKTDLHAC
jgi:hypothetical protein